MYNNVSHFPLERKQVTALLKEYGITPTRQRIEIAFHLFQKQQHVSAEKILEQVNAMGNTVSRATVYNTMALLTRKGLVREVLIDRERVFYDSNNHPHHHFYNMDTGELSDIDDSVNVDVGNITGLPEGLRVVDTDVVIKVAHS